MKNNSLNQEYTTFESIKHTDEYGNEFWYARALAKILGYADYRNFRLVIGKAKKACELSNYNVLDHFVDTNDMIEIGKGGMRNIDNVKLSRYACYLIVQNADATKPVIANGQTYFAVQTRRQELQDAQNAQQLTENEKRLLLRNELKEHNKQLVKTASNAGVKTQLDFAIFQNHGYKGLYGGLDAKDIHSHKGLKKSQKILDHMSSTELAANLFRATQTEDKLKRDNIQGKTLANKTHYAVGKKVRETIQALGGTMPEISRFLGIVIKMYWSEHNPPHFHAEYNEYEAEISIKTLNVKNGRLPARVLGLVLEWAELHQAELLMNWESLQTTGEFARIAPLI